ncbi:PREDICTED: uncharacterized protein LOC108661569 [Theobroma cacao]|uniref:Uncharacterized protein LOC108661569 n=1 Tax=Theobroma cacao TaxID=3641 RepID=A0AB32W8U5_THECC|nr:PREDICTED: uncharacterized protein LOC108661569 [Theobroma cacao]
MAPFEAIYGWICKSPIGWLEVGERKLLGLELVQDATEKIHMIRQRMLSTQRRQKSYADNRRRDLEFQVEDQVFLKVSPTKGYNPNPSHVIRYETIQLKDDLTYKKQSVAILNWQVKKLSSKEVASVKVLWRNHTSEVVTWETEEEMRTKYPHLFDTYRYVIL